MHRLYSAEFQLKNFWLELKLGEQGVELVLKTGEQGVEVVLKFEEQEVVLVQKLLEPILPE